MSRIDEYRQKLGGLSRWEPYLRQNSGLPGPRGNLELARAVALESNRTQTERLLKESRRPAAENTPGVFLVFCGVLGLGMLIARGKHQEFERLRGYASDPRWRVREAVAMALQLVGDHDAELLLRTMRKWRRGSWYEKRAVAAGLAEPRLLKDRRVTRRVLEIFDQITADVAAAPNDRAEDFQVLRQGMAYCWSVAVAALPEEGKPAMERWLGCNDPNVRWVLRQNLKKNRLVRMDAHWVKLCSARLG